MARSGGLLAAVRGRAETFIDSWNDHPHPFAWTKDADRTLASIDQAKTKTSVLTDH
jgi:hypothetical protein